MTYSVDFRYQVLAVREKENLSFANAAKRFGIGLNTVVRWSKKIAPTLKRNKPATKIDMEGLKKDVEDYPDAYQYERAQRLKVSKAAIWYALKRLGVSYKKNAKAPQSGRPKACYILPKN